MATIDTTKTAGEYQALAAYSAKRIAGGWTGDDREANRAALEEVRTALRAAGFREYKDNPAMGGWYSADCYARIAVDYDRGTIGVEVSRDPTLAAYANHDLDGTYDALPLAEKHRLSGFGGSVEDWLREFDRCGKARPGNGREHATT
jgi:hypothetical protein